MELHSDFSKRDNLETEDIKSIHFIECSKPMRGGDDDDDWEYTLKGGENQDLHDIFVKAKEYKANLLHGGEDKPPRKANKVIMAFQAISSELKKTGKYSDLKHKQFLSVSKLIWDDAKKITGSTDADVLLKKAMELIKKSDEYVNQYKKNISTSSDIKSDTFKPAMNRSAARFSNIF